MLRYTYIYCPAITKSYSTRHFRRDTLLTFAVLPPPPKQTQQYNLIRSRPFPSKDSTTHQQPIIRPLDPKPYEILSRKIRRRKITTATCFGSSYTAIFRLSPKNVYVQLTMFHKVRDLVYLLTYLLLAAESFLRS